MFETTIFCSRHRKADIMLVVATALMLLAPPVWSQVTYRTGVDESVLRPFKTVSLDSLSPIGVASGSNEEELPSNGLSKEAYRALKEKASTPSLLHRDPAMLALPKPASAGPLMPGAPAGPFDGNSKSRCGGFVSPDMAIAVGDHQSTHPIVQINNRCISLFKSDGTPRYDRPKALESLFNAPKGVDVFDPRALYDWANQRYIIVATEKDESGKEPGHYWIAVSQANNSAGNYFVYRLPVPSGANGVFADFPRLGQDRDFIYLASNIFSDSGGPIKYEEWLMLPKVWLYEGSGLIYRYIYDTKVNGVPTDTSQPANVWNPADGQGVFFVSSRNLKPGGGYQCTDIARPCNGLFVWWVDAHQPTPYLKPIVSGVSVPTAHNYLFPGEVRQKGTPEKLDGGDNRISGQVSYSAGSLFAALTTRSNAGGAATLLFKIQPEVRDARVTAKVADEGLIDYPGDYSTIYPTSQSDPQGNAITVFEMSGPDMYPSTAFILRRNGMFPNPGVIVREGKAPYINKYGWGDYTAVAPGPPRPVGGTTWFAGKYAAVPPPNHVEWSTVVGLGVFPSSGQSN